MIAITGATGQLGRLVITLAEFASEIARQTGSDVVYKGLPQDEPELEQLIGRPATNVGQAVRQALAG